MTGTMIGGIAYTETAIKAANNDILEIRLIDIYCISYLSNNILVTSLNTCFIST